MIADALLLVLCVLGIAAAGVLAAIVSAHLVGALLSCAVRAVELLEGRA